MYIHLRMLRDSNVHGGISLPDNLLPTYPDPVVSISLLIMCKPTSYLVSLTSDVWHYHIPCKMHEGGIRWCWNSRFNPHTHRRTVLISGITIYANEAIGTGKCVLFIKVSSFRAVNGSSVVSHMTISLPRSGGPDSLGHGADSADWGHEWEGGSL